jgi:hypothetical protein
MIFASFVAGLFAERTYASGHAPSLLCSDLPT